jgi:hypothetical protein
MIKLKADKMQVNTCYHWVQNPLPSYLQCENIKFKMYKTVVLYGCETWYHILNTEHGIRVFENRVLRIFGPKRNEVVGGWKKLCNEELHSMYSSPNVTRMIKSRRMRWAGHVAHTKEKRNSYSDSLIKPDGKRPMGRSRCRWENNINMDIMIGWYGLD